MSDTCEITLNLSAHTVHMAGRCWAGPALGTGTRASEHTDSDTNAGYPGTRVPGVESAEDSEAATAAASSESTVAETTAERRGPGEACSGTSSGSTNDIPQLASVQNLCGELQLGARSRLMRAFKFAWAGCACHSTGIESTTGILHPAATLHTDSAHCQVAQCHWCPHQRLMRALLGLGVH
eukprot:1742478-Rhodomonas_salina.1